ncbi:Uncharacterised protein [Morganella morganii]|nr:Uncharacterised protein [Morganella morganii]
MNLFNQSEFLALALVHFFIVVSPGPDFAVTLRQSIYHGRKAGLMTALRHWRRDFRACGVHAGWCDSPDAGHTVADGYREIHWCGLSYLAGHSVSAQ